jgi:hypothetical protein
MSRSVVVGGALANKAGSGGEAWVRMSWVRGLQSLGLDTWFVEQANDPTAEQVAYFDRTIAEFGLGERATLITGDGVRRGPAMTELLDVAAESVLVNISGHIDLPELFASFRRRVYVDIDPGFTQSWWASDLPGHRLDGHDVFATIGEGIGRADCPIPTCGLDWLHVRQPVVLDDWRPPVDRRFDRFTTVGSWRGPFGPVTIDDRSLGLKVHEFRRFLSLPADSGLPFELALAIDPADSADRAVLVDAGWALVQPSDVADGPRDFRRYVEQSGAEFSVAQGVYVHTRSGWFSDRTVRYLASGRPALVQDTGFARTLPTGTGLVAFGNLDEAVAGAADIVARYDEHAARAREIAASYFDARAVLGRFCEQCSIG